MFKARQAQTCLGALLFLLPKSQQLCGFAIFWLWAYMMLKSLKIPKGVIKIIPENIRTRLM